MFINAEYIDEVLTGLDKSRSTWSVHSIFNKSLNIQNVQQNRLIHIASSSYAKMPEAIYIEEGMLKKLITTVKVNQSIKISSGQIDFGNAVIFLNRAKAYFSQLAPHYLLNKASFERYIAIICKLEKENGFGFPISALKNNSSIQVSTSMNQLNDLFLSDLEENKKAVQYLIGRGKGLTPSGDDMLIGVMAANRFIQRLPELFYNNVKEILSSDIKPTTFVSEHYLNCALQHNFNELIIQLVTSLSKDTGRCELEKNILEIGALGHTSGLDMLTGFTAALLKNIQFEEEGHG